MSLFGGQQNAGGSLFGSTTQNNQQKPANPFAAFGSSTPATNSGLTTGGSLFGASNNSQPQQSSSLFGSSPAQPQQASQPQQSGGLFGSTGQQSGGGLFGSTNQQSGGGGLFGQSNQQSGGGGLFGQSNQQSGGGLFGQQPKAPEQTQNSGGGLFGAPQQQSQPAQGGSLFGGMGQNQSQAQPQSGGLFGGTNTQTKPTLSLFGASNNAPSQQPQQQQPQQPQSSLFGNTSLGAAPNAQQRMPGSLTMGQSGPQNQQQTVPGVRIDMSNIRGTTRFNDLHEELQKQIEQIDAFIQQQIAFKEQCDAIMPAHEQNLSSIPDNVDYVKTVVETTESALENDSAAINTMKTITQKDAEDARTSFRAVENLKLPQQFHYSGIWRPSASGITPPRGGTADRSSGPRSGGESTDLVSYFNNQTAELSSTLETYKRNISDIETHLGTVEANVIAQSQQLMFRKGRDGGARGKEEQVRELESVLRQFEQGIIGVAGKVGAAREAVVDAVEGGQGGILARR